MSPLDERQLGVLLHPTSLPGRFGIGDLGPEARRFVDWLARAGARLWQVLPVCPPAADDGVTPYVSGAALAGYPLLVSLEDLVAEGLLEPSELVGAAFEEGSLERPALDWKRARLERAAERLLAGHPLLEDYRAFRARAAWAEEAALFFALDAAQAGRPWWSWPRALRDREPAALARAQQEHAASIERQVVGQFLFERQWQALRVHAAAHGVRVLGDLAIYVRAHGVDVWAHREGFQVEPDGTLRAQSGCPPDVFAPQGQRWGGPVYDWDRMAEDGYRWWIARLRRAFEHADAVRLDHFRAFSAFWSIDPQATTAAAGRWVKGPGRRFFEALERALGPRALCVEDLGTIDDDVLRLRDGLGFPGMKILQFGFGGDAHDPHLPHNHPENALVYPGNHDTDTTVGWFAQLPGPVRSHVQHYLGRHGDDIAWDLIRAALASVARVAIVPMQDVLALGSGARMNDPTSYARPAHTWRNWLWRLKAGEASEARADRLRFLAELYGRR
jgi:4-alpha-glucanotransferase